MSGGFDPYHKWLGIPPEEQPPNRYRLLGIQPLEDDPEVIEAAADQRMLLLRTYQTGRHSELSQELLNEVAAAKVCLLNSQKKAAYDRQLRQELVAAAEARICTPPRVEPVRSPGEAETPDKATPQVAPGRGSRWWTSKRAVWPLPVLASGLLVAGALAYVYWPDRDPPAAPPSASLVFVVPEGAGEGVALKVDGRDVDLHATGPLEVPCQPGKHEILAECPGYEPVARTVAVEAGEQVRVELRWEALPTVLVFDWPPDERQGATLSVDGRRARLLADARYILDPGVHTFTATRGGFATIRQEVTLEAGQQTIVKLDWQEAPVSPPKDGTLTLVWPEALRVDASVLIDGQSVRVPPTGPCEYPLPPGEHDLAIHRPGYEPAGQSVTVAAGRKMIVEVVLREKPPPEPTVVKKLPEPSQADRQEVEARIRKVFDRQYAAATTPEGRRELAALLLEQAGQIADDPLARYAMLTQAAELAVEVGEVIVARDALTLLIEHYEVDAWALRADALSGLLRAVREPAARASVAQAALNLVEPALDEDRLEEAERLAEVAVTAAAQLRDVELRKTAQQLRQQVRDRRKIWKRYQPAFETIEQRPDDPDANLEAGEYLCFIKGNWSHGLPHLIKGSDAALSALARADSAQPEDAAKQVELGDRWRMLAARQSDLAKREIRSRAAYWYNRALPRLSGLEKVGVEKSLEAIRAADADHGAQEDAAASGVTADRLVIWNAHNAAAGDRGTSVCNVLLLRDGQVVWQARGVRPNWAPTADPMTVVKLPRQPFDALRIEIAAVVNSGGGLSEVEVYRRELNIARGRPVRASAVQGPNFSADKLTDGINQSRSQAVGYWLLPARTLGWIEIDFSDVPEEG